MPRLTPAFIVSILVHLALLGFAFIVWPEDAPPPEVKLGAVPVSVVSDVVREAAPAPTPAEEPSDEPIAESPVEQPTPEPPAPTPTPPRPTPPRPTPPQPERPRPQPPRPAPDRPRPTPERPTPERPTPPRPTPPRPSPPRPTPPQQELNLDELAGGGRPGDRTQPGRPPAGERGQGEAPAATGPQIAAIGAQVIPHWDLPCNLPGGDNLTIRMNVGLSADGRITSGPTLVRPESGAVWRAAAEAAQRAARLAAPYDVPDGFRAQVLPFRFDTATACRNR